MGQEPDRIREEIAHTREQMEQTVDAIGYRADVPARAKENVHGKVEAMSSKVGAVKDRIVGQAHDLAEHAPSPSGVRDSTADAASSGADAAKENARRAASVAQENPLGLAIGAAAVGFLGGLLIPTTRAEEQKLGPVASQLREQALDAGHEVIEQGKVAAHDAAEAAADAVGSAAA